MRGKDIFKVLVGFGIITILTWDGIANKYKEGVKILKNESYAVRKPFKKLYIWYVPLYIDSISYPDIKKKERII